MNETAPFAQNGGSRRDFLVKSAGAAAVWTGAGLALNRAVYAGGDDTLRVALIGCGGRGTGAAGNCLNGKDNLKLVCVADLFRERAERALKRLKRKYKDRVAVSPDRIVIGFDAYRKVFALDEVDYVILATPPAFRPEHYAAAVRAGKHVFMEKPCCVDAPGFRLLMETNKLADQKGIKVAVGLQRRHSKSYRQWLEEVRSGVIGDIEFLRVYWNGAFASSGYGERRSGETEMEFQIRNWNHFRWLSGDHIVEQHVHNLDVANWILDAHPIEANGMGAQVQRKRSQNFDHHFVEFTYPDGRKVYSQCRQMSGCWNKIGEVVHGTKGVKELGGHGSDGYDNEHADLVAAIRNGTKLNDGWHGATSSFTGVLGRMATYSGKVIRWDEAVAKGPDEGPKQTADFTLETNPPVLPDSDGTYQSHVPVPGVYKAF
ncbi:MAG: Gfo/Idh/MocA family oxidoreductase [Planctomycetes bacterium]|nr:Gfo/Idh/MocA family oxidoreductase [Planctomycetota bacterium]